MITHQKRTMEIADALYGVTMRGDGVSAVISQRLRETESVALVRHRFGHRASGVIVTEPKAGSGLALRCLATLLAIS